ncbi:MAG: hypothetical protein ACK41T_07750 [Pseudobdellovibrio sp.]
MKINNKIGLFVCLLSVTGCLKIQKKLNDSNETLNNYNQEQKNTLNISENYRDIRVSDIRLEYIGNPHQSNLYDVKLYWPKTTFQVAFVINDQIIYQSQQNQSEYIIQNLQGGVKKLLQVSILNSENSLLERGTLEIVVPQDVSLSGQLNLQKDMSINAQRVFIDGAHIYTGIFNFVIQTQELIIVKDTTIQSFPLNAKALTGQNGRSGGLIKIVTQAARGERLKFILNSESGGDGFAAYRKRLDNSNQTESCNGLNGANAGKASDLFLKIYDDHSQLPVIYESYKALAGLAGPAYNKIPVGYPAVLHPMWHKCGEYGRNGDEAVDNKVCIVRSEVSDDCFKD